MKSVWFFFAAFWLFTPLSSHAQAGAAPAAHEGHGPGAMAGIKKEMIEGIGVADFIRLSDKEKTVKVTLVAVWTEENYGMNFNGFAKGAAVYTIPLGWTVEVEFINPSPIPHSLIVIERADTKKIQVAEPYFKGAVVPNHLQGLSFAKASFSFVADEAGEFAFACGFPAHTLNGHWLALEIDESAKVPTLKLGDEAAREATK